MNQLDTKEDRLSLLLKIRDKARFKISLKDIEWEENSVSSKEAIERHNKGLIRERCLRSAIHEKERE